MKVTGEKEVLGKLNREIQNIRGRTMAGVIAAGQRVQKTAVKKTPVDTGNLRGSRYVKPLLMNRNKPAVEVGNNAEYAIYVHENLEANHPVGEAKFLEKAIIQEKHNILMDIAKRASV